ncbi:Uncharacterised protein [uncultured Clostridium sp.]|nr:Uncharacterised protein [uncultured Clostridium sp.]
MIDVLEYWDRDAAAQLCAAIGMPQEAMVAILPEYRRFDPSGIARAFPLLLDRATGPMGVAAIEPAVAATGARAPWVWLAILLAAAGRREELDRERGIPEQVTLDTLAALSRFVRDFYTQEGSWGFRGQGWIWRQLSGGIYRIGALEFERFRYHGPALGAGEAALTPGEKLLSVHIPGDTVLTEAAIADAYARAEGFFARFAPDWDYQKFYCDSWMLSPRLKKLLKPASRILRFQRDYEILEFNGEDCHYIRWIFGAQTDPALFKEETSLQRSVKAYVLAGGSVGAGVGVFAKGRYGLIDADRPIQ